MSDSSDFYFYLNNKILKGNDLNISPFDRGFLFGDGVYETIRWYKGKLFKLEDHIERLRKSLASSRINFSDFDEIENAISKLVKVNNFSGDHLLVYLQISRGNYFPRQHIFPPDIKPTFFLSVTPYIRKESELKNGVKIILEEDVRWMRCDIKSTMLLANVLAKQKAFENHAMEAVLIRNGNLTEGTHTSFCAVKNGKLFTPPLSNLILDGVTRKVVLEICKVNNIRAIETEIRGDELKSFDEMMVLGTISEITPVVQVNDWKVRDGKPGQITMKLQNFLSEMIFS